MLRNFDDIMGNIDPFNYKIKENIAEGPATEIYRAIEKKSLKEYAIIFSFHKKNELKRYIDTLMRLRNIYLPGVVKLYGYKIYKNNNNIDDLEHFFNENLYYGDYKSYFYLIRVYDLMKNGNIRKMRIKDTNNQIIKPLNIIKIIYGISSTMKSLHDIHFLHRNLKPTKIFLNENYEPQILLDIESVFMKENEFLNESEKLFSEGYHLFVPYMNTVFNAPEIAEKKDYSYPIDVYSFGIILYILFSKKNPLRTHSYKINLIRPSNISDDIWELIIRCTYEDPDRRISFKEIIDYIKINKFFIDENENKFDFLVLMEYQKKLELTQ